MLKNKTIQVFDIGVLKANKFITFCYTTSGDDGERIERTHLNGIISSAYEDKLYVTLSDATNRIIELDSVLEDKVRIKGVKLDAI